MQRLHVHSQQGTGSTSLPDPYGIAPPGITLDGKGVFKIGFGRSLPELVVDEEAAKAQTITTHRGAFRVKRLRFGVSVAPGIFQSYMDDVLMESTWVVPYSNDVLIAASTKEELAGHFEESPALSC